MTKEEFLEKYEVKEGCITLEPWDIFSKGIVDVFNHKRVIYDYYGLVRALSEDYAKDDKEFNLGFDHIEEAVEWLEYNTIRSLPYMNEEFRPFIVSISTDEYESCLDKLKSLYGNDKINELLEDEKFIIKVYGLREDCCDDVEFETCMDKLVKETM